MARAIRHGPQDGASHVRDSSSGQGQDQADLPREPTKGVEGATQ